MPPRLSIITPVYDPPLSALRACADSVLGQAGVEWEWCVVDDCSTREEIVPALRELERDPRVKVRYRQANGGLVAATRDAVDMATGEYLVLLDHDDALAGDVLRRVAEALDDAPGIVDYLFTDEVHVAMDGQLSVPFPKPRWSPERFRGSMYTCHLSVLRHDAVDAVGGFRVGFDGSQDHDIVLRVTEHAAEHGNAVVHLPVMGYHWRTVTTSVSRAAHTVGRAVENGRRAVQEQCDRLGIEATVEHGPIEGTYRLQRPRPAGVTATVVVAGELHTTTRERPHRLALAVTAESIRTDAADTDFVLAYPKDSPGDLVDLLTPYADRGWELLPVEAPFDVAAALDRALTAFPADVVVSVAPGLVSRADLTPRWLDTLLALAWMPGAGLAAGLLCDPDDTVIHAGWEAPDYRSYCLEGLKAGIASVGNDLLIERETDQVSLAFAALGTRMWRQIRESVSGSWNEAGIRASNATEWIGGRNVWTPHARFDRALPVSFGPRV